MRWAPLCATVLALGCDGRERSPVLDTASSAEGAGGDPAAVSGGHVLELDLSAGVRESPDGGLFLSMAASRTYVGLLREIERAATNPDVKGFFLRLGGASFGWARSEELGGAFEALREKAKKPVVCHAHSLDNATAWLAARACSRVWVSPAGGADTVGVAAQVVYLRGALDKLKVRADFVHMGRYKSAAETFMQEGPSEEARESLTAVLGSMRRTWLDGATAARKHPDLALNLEDGPFGPEDAKERGLVDAIGYESEARQEAQSRSGVKHTVTGFGGKTKEDAGLPITEILRLLAGGESPMGRPHVAVIPAEGSIAMGAGSPFSDAGITHRALQRVIRKLAADDAVKAVVLRIDSPGGSALASDLLWHDLMELRKKKPLVASVGDMAASGGYYLACAANKVVAPRTSIVGSIGVVGGKIVFEEALADLGVHAVTFPASPQEGALTRAAYLSPLTPWDDATRDRVKRQMESVYELFLRRVAEGRAMPIDAVRAVAEGRIWSGVQAHKLRLVDELGGLGRALEIARGLGSLDADAPVRVEGLSEGILETLLVGEGAEEAEIRAAVARATERQRRLAPVERSLRPFVAALSPLLDGEVIAATLPFALVVR